jgi:hypothetical protein
MNLDSEQETDGFSRGSLLRFAAFSAVAAVPAAAALAKAPTATASRTCEWLRKVCTGCLGGCLPYEGCRWIWVDAFDASIVCDAKAGCAFNCGPCHTNC